jgi:hypothetical protein
MQPARHSPCRIGPASEDHWHPAFCGQFIPWPRARRPGGIFTRPPGRTMDDTRGSLTSDSPMKLSRLQEPRVSPSEVEGSLI